jgi:signal transduction histidine kinase
MTHFRLRTQLFVATLLIICVLTGALLFIVRHTVSVETSRQIRYSTENSVRAFESVQRQREMELSRTAAMLADVPILKALMTTQHPLTIQDGSRSLWQLAGSDLFVLAKPDSNVVALHMKRPGWDPGAPERDLRRSVEQGEESAWWYDDGRLYWVFLRPIISGGGNNSREVGLLAVGYQVDSSVAAQLAMVAGGPIALATGKDLIASTLPQEDEAAFARQLTEETLRRDGSDAREITLATEPYVFSSVLLHGALPSPVRCYVLMPMGGVNDFMHRLNRTIFIVGASAVVLGALIFGFVAQRITKPLDNLVAGVRALAAGDYAYSIKPEGATEVAELGTSFAKMRGELLASQQQRIETERIAALAQAASSLSHDLRHYLAAVVANAEFLYEADELDLDKDEIYQEIKTASNQMLDLIDSLRELSYQRRAISREPTNLTQVIRHAIETVQTRPDFRHREFALNGQTDLEGAFDPKKLGRAFFNLLLNACEATSGAEGLVTVDMRLEGIFAEVRVADLGPGVPENIRGTLFDPFVSAGKPNGTGLGLAIVSKIVQDHEGSVSLESTSEMGTVILVKLPVIREATGMIPAAKPAEEHAERPSEGLPESGLAPEN